MARPRLATELDAEYSIRDYHKVSDKIKPTWDFRGAAADAAFLVELGRTIAEGDVWPEWQPGTEFKSRRVAMMKGAR